MRSVKFIIQLRNQDKHQALRDKNDFDGMFHCLKNNPLAVMIC